MRLGISSSLNKNSAKEWAEAMVKLGCKSVVFPLNCEASDELVDEYVSEARKNDLVIAEVGVWRNAISLDEKEREASLKYSIGQLKLADRIGANCCVNITGSTGKRWDGAYKENFTKDTWDRSVEMIQRVIDEAAPTKTFFTIEPMPWMVPSSPEEYLKLIDDVNREHLRCIWTLSI